APDGGDDVHAGEMIDVVAQRRPRIEQNWYRCDGGQHRKQRGDPSIGGVVSPGSRRGFVGADCGLRASRHRLAASRLSAESTEMIHINHSGLQAAEPLPEPWSDTSPA